MTKILPIQIAAEVDTFTAKIYLAGDIREIEQACREFCMSEGLCVTVNPTWFVYTGGQEGGAEIGLINHGKFPATPQEIRNTAIRLAKVLIERANQWTATVVMPDKTLWLSRKPDDLEK